MDEHVLTSLLDRTRPLARVAGKAIVEVAAEGTEVTEKADGSPLTRADLASHNVIVAGLEAIEPGFPILSEEGDLKSFGGETWQTYWCVDPLDGTKEFVKGLTEYTVNIALVDGGRPILGVVYVPVQDVLYYAAKSQGAWKVESDGVEQRIAPSRCERPATAVVSRSHLSADTEEFLKRLNVTNVISHGSSVKICAVAEGRADIYPRHGPTCLWDTAAGAAVAVEAGCAVMNLAGEPLSYDAGGGIKHSGFLVYPSGLDIETRRQSE